MKVKCIAEMSRLTRGKTYSVIKTVEHMGVVDGYTIINDRGFPENFPSHFFNIIEEEQGEKVLSHLEKEYGIKDVNYKIMYVPLEQMRKDCGIKNICNSASKGKLRYATVEGKIKHFSPPQIIIEDNEFGLCILNMDQVINMIPNMEEE